MWFTCDSDNQSVVHFCTVVDRQVLGHGRINKRCLHVRTGIAYMYVIHVCDTGTHVLYCHGTASFRRRGEAVLAENGGHAP